MAKGASLLPSDFASGGAVPDGRYTITGAQAVQFDYGGRAEAVPAAAFVYHAASDGRDYEQNYSAGKLENLVPSDDGTEFLHPGGELARINKSSNFAAFIASILGAGFPQAELTSNLKAFVGSDVEIVNVAQPKRPGLKDQVEGKTIPLPTKYYGKVKAGAKPAARPTLAKPAAATPKPVAAPAPTSSPVATEDVEELARATVLEIMVSLPENTGGLITPAKLGTAVMMSLAKARNPNMQAAKKLVQDATWLTANAEPGGWAFDGANVSLLQ